MLDLLLWGLEVQRRDQHIHDGVKAVVKAYYDNNTDATELEPSMIHGLLTVVDHIYTDEFDLQEAVVEAEREINDGGGIVGSEGDRHRVGPTFRIEPEEE